MDFKFSESYDDGELKSRKRKKIRLDDNMKKIITIVIFIVVMVGAFILLFRLLNKNKQVKYSKVDKNDTLIQELYKAISFDGNTGVRSDFFVKDNVIYTDFNNDNKFYYALYNISPKDFTKTNIKDGNNYYYSLPVSVVDQYMLSFFGQDVSYTMNTEVNLVLNTKIGDYNAGMLFYNKSTKDYRIVFDKLVEKKWELPKFISKLDSAYKSNKGDIKLVEKIIYLDCSVVNNKYKCNINRDYQGKKLIISRDMSKEDIDKLSVDDYSNLASTITYTFKSDPVKKGSYYFYSSEIK